jgi:hypothetical protein
LRKIMSKKNNTDSQNGTVASSHFLHITGQDGSEIQRGLGLSDVDVIQAKAGEQYRVILEDGSLADDVAAVKTGDNLDVHFEDGPHLVIEDYFLVCTEAECGITLVAENEAGVLIRANDPAAHASSASLVFYSHGDVNSTLLALAEKDVFVEPAKKLDTDPTSPEGTQAGSSGTMLLGLGAAALGLIGLGASSGGSSGANDGPGMGGLSAAPVPALTPAPPEADLSGTTLPELDAPVLGSTGLLASSGGSSSANDLPVMGGLPAESVAAPTPEPSEPATESDADQASPAGTEASLSSAALPGLGDAVPGSTGLVAS